MDESDHVVRIPKGTTGYPVLGPFMPLPPETYRFRLPISWDDCTDIGSTIVTFEVIINNQCAGSVPVVAHARRGSRTVTSEVEVKELAFASHIRLLCAGAATIEVPLELAIEPEPWEISPRSAWT
jgi:hypothetical protein